jgi:hypothetical protein
VNSKYLFAGVLHCLLALFFGLLSIAVLYFEGVRWTALAVAAFPAALCAVFALQWKHWSGIARGLDKPTGDPL